MEALIIEPTKSTPYVSFNPQTGLMQIRGESYPENAAKFYSPIFNWLEEYFGNAQLPEQCVFELELIYFNSSTSKALMNLFEMLEILARKGISIAIMWKYDPENETAFEAGEEYREEANNIQFELIASSASS